jgi:tetratricopeptide (TPR) repeat protein
MPQTYTCPLGHTWEAAGDEPAACPVCAPAESREGCDSGAFESGIADELPPPPSVNFVPAKPPPAPAPDAGGPAVGVPGYEVLGELGRGGMGVVYKARDQRLGRDVALKVLVAGEHAAGEGRERFRREAEAVAALQHPNIVQVFEVGEHRGLPYLALELVEGESLARRLAAAPLRPRPAAELVETLARAVHHAHQRGVVHRDLKPANVLVASGQWPVASEKARSGSSSLATGHWPLATPKITDFGLAKRVGDAGQTQSGAVMGTPSYMAPEQAAGQAKHVGPAADVYALGAVLYECLTGRPPFKAATPVDTILQVISTDPVGPSRLQPGVPRDLETVCLKCLRKEPRRRYSSAEALADDLRRFLDGRPVAARRTPWWERVGKWARRRPAAAALLAVSAAAVAGLLAFGYVRNRELERHASDLTAERDKVAAAHAESETQRERAEQNLEHAVGAVEQMLSRVGADRLGRVPLMDKTRTELLEDAERFFDKLLASQAGDPRLRALQAHTLERSGTVNLQLGRYGPALDRYDRALALLGELRAEAPEQVPADTLTKLEAAVRYDRGLLFARRGDGKRARPEYEAALALREKLLAAAPEDPEARYAVAVTQLDLAYLARAEGDTRRTELYLGRARQASEELTRPTPTPRLFLYLHGAVLNSLGVYYVETGEAPRGAEVLAEAEKVWRRLTAADPGDIEYAHELGRCLGNLGLAWREQGYLRRAEGYARESLAVRERLARDHPEVPEFTVGLGWGLVGVGKAHLARDEYGPAAEQFTRAIEALERAGGGGPLREPLREAYIGRGDAAARRARYADAADDLGKALRLADDPRAAELHVQRGLILAHAGRPAEAAKEVEAGLGGPPLPRDQLFDAARALAVAARGESDRDRADRFAARAVRLLEDARVAGAFRTDARRAWINTHPDLSALRGRADFEAVCAKVGPR